MPVYWYSISAKIKAVIDKTFPFGMDNENVAGKGCGLICCCTTRSEERRVGKECRSRWSPYH